MSPSRFGTAIATLIIGAAWPVAESKSAEVLLRFASTAEYEHLFSETITAFEQDVEGRGRALFHVVKIDFQDSDAIAAALEGDAVDVSIIPASRSSLPVGSYIPGAGVQGSRKRQQSEVGALELAKLERENLVGLAFWNAPPRFVASKAKLLQSSDVTGLKVQAVDPGQRAILEVYGAVPLDLGIAEVRTALESDVLDAAAVAANSDTSAALAKTVVPAAGSAVEYYLVARKTFWATLSQRARAALAEAGRSSGLLSDRQSIARFEETLRELASQGTNILDLGDDRRSEVANAAIKAWVSRSDKPDASILELGFAKSFDPIPPRPPQKGAAAAARKVFFATSRADNPEEDIDFRFGTDRVANSLVYGSATVHLRQGRAIDDDLEIVSSLDSVAIAGSSSDFGNELAAGMSGVNEGVLVFIHGYSNKFTDAVRRAAHIAVETGFSGPVIAFSWPSEGATLLYDHDEDRIQAAQTDFRAVMGVIERAIGRDRTNLLAHSMGARVLLGYIDTLSVLAPDSKKLRSITFAAGDTPNEVLRSQVEFMKKLSSLVTIYFSEKDRALWLSNKLHIMARIGNNDAGQLFINAETAAFGDAGFDFVDARFIDDDTFTFSPRHAYLFDKPKAVQDLAQLIVQARSAVERQAGENHSLLARENVGKRYWELSPR